MQGDRSRIPVPAIFLVAAVAALPMPWARADGSHRWSRGLGGSGNDSAAEAVVDAAGNSYVTGSFSGSADFGGGLLTSAGSTDSFVVKYSSSGSHVWSKRYGGGALDTPRGIAIGPDGTVVVAGQYSGTTSWGGSTFTSASTDAIFAKYDGVTGNHIWSRSFGGTGFDSIAGVEIDASNNVIVAATLGTGPASFGGATFTTFGVADIVIAKYDSGGNHLWSRQFGGTSSDFAFETAINAAGDIFLAGGFDSPSIDFGGGPLFNAAVGFRDVLVARLTGAAGAHVWSRRFGGAATDVANGVALDEFGNPVLTGSFASTASFGGPPFTSAGSADVWAAKFTGPTGAHVWSGAWGSPGTDEGYGVDVDTTSPPGSGGPVFLTGHTAGSLSFGGPALPAANLLDPFVVELTGSTGSHVWSRLYTGTAGSDDVGQSITTDPAHNIVVAGMFTGPFGFGGTGLPGAGGTDGFVASLNGETPAVPITQTSGTTAVAEGGATDTYTVRLATQPVADVTVTPATAGGQVTMSPPSLTFTPANWSSPQTVTVTAVNDAVDEASPHTATITHAASSADTNYNGISVASVVVSITDNDTAGVTLTQTGGTTVVIEGGGADTYSIRLDSQPTASVTITPSFTPGQLTLSPATMTFTTINWGTAQSFTVSAVNDSTVEGQQLYTVTHAATSSDPAYSGISVPSVTVTVNDNDVAGATISETSGSTRVVEAGATDTYTIVLTAQPAASVTVTPTDPSGQVTVSPSSVTFTTGNWSTPKTITVAAVDDAAPEPYTHTGVIGHAVSSADPNFDGLSVASVTVEITDNDDAAAPVSTFTTGNNAILRFPPLGNDVVAGSSTDSLSGIASVEVTFQPLIGSATSPTETVTCPNANRLSCTWTAPLPGPGIYMVNTRATDRNGNVETPGPTITIIVV